VASLAAQLAGLEADIPMTPRGPSGGLTPRAEVDVEVGQLWSTIAEAVMELMVTLPDEPVGIGARWRSYQRLRRGGVAMLRRTRFTLKSLDPELVLVAELDERPVAGSSEGDPAVPAGVLIAPREGHAHGTRTLRRNPGSWLPGAAESHLDSQLELATRPDPKLLPDAPPARSSVHMKQDLVVSGE
jgi:hypothetical protein